MTLPASGAISLSQVDVELGRASTATISLGETAVRTLFGVASGAISMSNGYGKANAFVYTITEHLANANLRSYAISKGWNGTSAAVITLAAGYYIYATSTDTPALTINGSWPGGLTFVNNGYVMGMGGVGSSATVNAGAGGNAISLGVSCTINGTSGYIGGGGGGGGGMYNNTAISMGGGGGAGGGAGGHTGYGGAGGGIGSSGANGSYLTDGTNNWIGGGGGGRILPGSGGASRAGNNSSLIPYAGFGGGSGGSGGSQLFATNEYSGAGGSSNASGGNGWCDPAVNCSSTSGGGGGWGAAGGSALTASGSDPRKTYGAGGKAVALNGYTVTWSNGFPSTRVYGAVS